MSDRSTFNAIIQAIIRRLEAKIPELTRRHNLFVSDQPQPVVWPSGKLCCVLSLGDSVFPEAFQAGGGVSTLTMQGSLDVTIWEQRTLDRPPEFEVAILGDDSGLVTKWQPTVMRVLMVETDSNDRVINWMPIDEDGVGLLRNAIAPSRASRVMTDTAANWAGMTFSFNIDFDWRL